MSEANPPAFSVQLPFFLPGLKRLRYLGLIVLAYFLSARLSLAFVAEPENLAAVWPPSGVMLAALLLRQRQDWPSILAAIFLTNLLTNLGVGNPFTVSLGFAAVNSLEGLVTAWLIIRSLGKSPTFTTLREILALAIWGAFLGNGLTAFLGAAVPSLGFGASYWDVWRVWWTADGLGILLITPLIVIWAATSRQTFQTVNVPRMIETVTVFALLAALAQAIFGNASDIRSLAPSPPIITFPLLIWVALRLGQRSVVLALLLLSAIAVWNTAHGLGPFAPGMLPLTQHILAVQLFLGASILSMLALSAAIVERQDAEVEIRKLNQELQQRVTELTTTNKELEAFSYSISHDLRAPLRAIDGYSRILVEDHAPLLEPAAVRYLGLVRSNAKQMGELIDDLLDFSRLGRQPLTKQTIQPSLLVRRVLDELRSEHEGRTVEISIGDLPPCQADPALLKQVFFNLLANALKFTRQRAVARIEVRCDEIHGEQVYAVIDNGAGFDMQFADKLFGVFQRLHRVQDYEGTGVGLAIAQRIIHRHGGRIWAESEVDKGAAFRFTLGGEQ